MGAVSWECGAQSLKPVFPGVASFSGTLKAGGTLLDGPVEVRTQLFNNPEGGTVIGQDPVSFTTTAVNGDFTTPLDVFTLAGGDAVSIRDCFRGAQNGFLQISVRRPGETDFSPLSPRQSLASMPLSLFAGNAINAEHASIADGLTERSLAPAALVMAPNAAPPAEGQILAYKNGGFFWTDSIGSAGPDASGSVAFNLGSLASFRFQPGNVAVFPGAAPSLVAGVLENRVSLGTGGNVIAGGGLPNSPNTIDGNQNFIGSGFLNSIGPSVDTSVIVAGSYNQIQRYSSGSFIGAGTTAVIGTNSPNSFLGAVTSGSIGVNSASSVIVGGGNPKIGFGSAYAVIVGGDNISIGTNSLSAAIVGGDFNEIGDQSYGAFIGSGTRNKIKATLNAASDNSVLVGGLENVLQSSVSSVLAGGYANNLVASSHSFIGGGNLNNIYTNGASVIAGGANNQIDVDASWSSIAGGQFNRIRPLARWSVVPGGYQNEIGSQADYSFIAGGKNNKIGSGPDGGSGSAIGGGTENSIGTNVFYSAVSGGTRNAIGDFAVGGAIGGGEGNTIGPGTGRATIPGGLGNSIFAGLGGGRGSTIGGGFENRIGGAPNTMDFHVPSVIAGGIRNQIEQDESGGTIGGGSNSTIEAGAIAGTIGGGGDNTIKSGSYYSTIPGGNGNEVGERVVGSFASGRRGKAQHDGSFVWSDGSTSDGIASNRTNQVTFQSVGGVRMITRRPDSGPMVGAELLPGSGSWSSMSDRNTKTNVAAINPRDVLARVARLPIGTWNYRSQDETVRHIGPMAQDFRESFGLGEDDRHISAVDADGVALAAIQGLNQRIEEQRTVIERKDGEVTDLQKRVAQLESLVRRLVSTPAGGGR